MGFAHNDADAFLAFVVDVLGFDPENIIDLRDTSKAQLEAAFGNDRSHEGILWSYLDPRGTSDVVVFYSGHGVPSLKDERGYLLPVDADPNIPEINGFPVDLLYENLGKLAARSIAVYLDACFSGNSHGGALIQSTSGLGITQKLPDESTGMTVLTAARGDQVASWDEAAGHGMFTKYLLEALRGAADTEEFGIEDDCGFAWRGSGLSRSAHDPRGPARIHPQSECDRPRRSGRGPCRGSSRADSASTAGAAS